MPKLKGANLVRDTNYTIGFVMTLDHVTLSLRWPWSAL